MNGHIKRCDDYLAARTGKYEWRAVRYRAALSALVAAGISDASTLVDVGAGWTEFDFCLRVDGGLRCRYIPVDGGIDGTDLNYWQPARDADFFVALEVLEHLTAPEWSVRMMKAATTPGGAIVISTPNPATTDVFGMDPTHITPITGDMLWDWGFDVSEHAFYGQERDSLFGVWKK